MIDTDDSNNQKCEDIVITIEPNYSENNDVTPSGNNLRDATRPEILSGRCNIASLVPQRENGALPITNEHTSSTFANTMRAYLTKSLSGDKLPLRKPTFTMSLALLLISFFVYGIISTPVKTNAIVSGIESPGFPNHMNFEYKLIKGYPTCTDMRMEWWRLITYQFVHLSVEHIFANVAGILMYGFVLESYITSNYARLQTIIAYELSVVMGILGQVYTDGYYRIIGASAGLYGLIGLSTSIMLSGDTTPFADFIILNTIPMQLLFDLIYFTIMYSKWIAYTAHFTGYITGVAVGNIFYIFSSKNRWTKMDTIFCIFGVGLGAFEISFLVYHYVVDFPPRFNINPTFDKPYFRYACCLDAYHLRAGNQSMTMDYITHNYRCIDNRLQN